MISYIASLLLVFLLFIAIPTPFLNFKILFVSSLLFRIIVKNLPIYTASTLNQVHLLTKSTFVVYIIKYGSTYSKDRQGNLWLL